MMLAMQAHLAGGPAGGPAAIRKCVVERVGGAAGPPPQELWYELPDELSAADVATAEDDAEPFLIALLMQAMAEGRSLHVGGAASRQLLSNLTEYRDAWHAWLPAEYHRVDFSCDRVVEAASVAGREGLAGGEGVGGRATGRGLGAVAAFSGGVDASFSVWRHATGRAGYRSHEVRACVFVHGFDIPLGDEAYGPAFQRARNTLGDLGIPLLKARTNYREVVTVNWEHCFAAALVSVLQHFKTVGRTAIVGSSEPYDSLVLPWGSNPVTDHLLSSESLTVIHDGASHSRTKKVAELARWPAGCAHLRVCWQGAARDRNCGRCEKCLRTMLNFRANNLPVPECFPGQVTAADVEGVRLPNPAVTAEWRQLLAAAVRNGVGDEWVEALSRRLA